ncbi:RteC domain-containing protein [Flavobacterium sp.]|uniref:RteC domain-containing protein n=1 Tax=Flavobacterium sp. TaxID=239 RepID=UPI00286EA7C5|nr:RteC domain-containing protein [Flavobacterium sp.]
MDSNYINYFNEFEREYEVLKNVSDDVLTVSLEIIHYIEKKLKEMFKWLKKHVFKTLQEEIYFFKELKPRMVSKLLYYKELLNLESSLPPSKKNKRKHYDELLSKIHQYVVSNKEFYQYYRSRTTVKDEDFFVRRSYKNIVRDDCCLINFDSKLCTSHDFNVAIIIANDMFTIYLENKLDELNGNITTKYIPTNNKITWTGTKIEMAEMIYGLYYKKMLNGGNIDIKEIAGVFSIAFNIDFDEKTLYRCLQDIKKRYPINGIFLQDLSDVANNKFRGEDF